ncbi:MAG: biopolymer transporter ExbD [Maricaulaceae bacterium]|jgi:biopolymer transport protein ExbD
MRKRLRRQEAGAEVNMTPMLDIVFILLIFFIVTATILQEEGLQMIAPPSDEQQQNEQQAESILVQIDDTNSIFVNGRLTDPARLSAAIQRQNVDNGGNSAVVIQPHPDAEHGVVTRAYDSASIAGLPAIIRKPEE